MSLLTDEGLPDPGNMDFFSQMLLGPIEQWFSQTQEMLASFGLDGAGTGVADFMASSATGVTGGLEGWSGQDADKHRELVQQDLQLAQQHSDAQQRAAEAVLWVVDTLQLIMTILLIIEILRVAIMLASTAWAFLTAGVSEIAAGEMTVQMLILEAVKRAIMFVLRSTVKLIFWVLRQALKNAAGTLIGGTAGALVAYNTVSSQHLSGGEAFWTYVQDIGFGALTGATVQAGLQGAVAQGGSAVWRVLGLNAGGVAAAGSQMWAQSVTTGQPLTAQTIFSDLTADVGLPEGALAARHEVNAMFAARGEQAAVAAQEGLRLSNNVDPSSRRWDFTSVTGRDLTPPLGNETQCAQAAMHDTASQFGVRTSISDLANASGYVPGRGTFLADAPGALGKALGGDPGALERIAGHPTALSQKITTLLANGDRAGAEAAAASAFRADGGFTVSDLDVRYRASKIPSTVVLNLDDGPHAVQFYGSFGTDVRLFDPSRGEAYTMRSAKFLDVWHGGQALVPDLGVVEVEPARVTPIQGVAQRIVDPLGRRGIQLEEAPELQVAGRDPKVVEQRFRANLREDAHPSQGSPRCTEMPASHLMRDPQLRTDVELGMRRYNRALKAEDLAPLDMEGKVWAVGEDGNAYAVRDDGTLVSGHGEPVPSGWTIERSEPQFTGEVRNLVESDFRAKDAAGHGGPPYYEPMKVYQDNVGRGGWGGAHYESHAEKQAGMAGDQLAPKSVGVSQEACLDCRWYHQTKARVTGARQVLIDPQATRIFTPDNTAILPDGTMRISPGDPAPLPAGTRFYPDGAVIVIPHGASGDALGDTAFVYDGQTAYDAWQAGLRPNAKANYHEWTP